MSFEKNVIAPGIIVYNVGVEPSNILINNIESLVNENWKLTTVVDVENDGKGIIDMQNRKCFDYFISNDFLDSPSHTPEKELLLQIKKEVGLCLDDYQKEYSIEPLVDSGWVMLKYQSADKFEWHVDAGQKYPRNVSITYYLNDEYEGGLIEYKHFGISYKPRAGDIIIFGSDYPYMHRVTPVINGTRYAVVNWYRYKNHPQKIDFNDYKF